MFCSHREWRIAASCAALALALAGCRGPAAPSSQASRPPEALPSSGGVLQLALAAPYATLDPLRENAPHPLRAVGPAYDQILKFDPADAADSRIEPALAYRWEQADDRTYVFSFRGGVKWHDGEPFTAEDARFTLERVAHPPAGVASPRRDWFANVERLETPDAAMLRVTLRHPQAAFLSFLAAGWSVVVPKHLLEQDPNALVQRAVGTGPFRQERIDPGVEGGLVRNPEYFVSGRPRLDGIHWRVIRDPSTALAAFRTKQVDLLQLTDAAQSATVRNDVPAAVVQAPPPSVQVGLRLRGDGPPLGDLRVRQAIHLAIDRDEVIRGAVQGFALPASPMPPGGSWAVPQQELLALPGFRKPKDQDLARARQLLEEAGYGGGFAVRMLLGQYDYVDNAGLVVADQLKRLGIQVETQKADFNTVLMSLPAGRFETAPYLAGLRVDDPDEWLVANYHTGGSRNYGGYSDPIIDDLLDRQSAILDPAGRKDLVRQASLRALDQAFQAPLFWLKTEVALQPWVKGYVAHSNSTNDYQHLDTWLDQAAAR